MKKFNKYQLIAFAVLALGFIVGIALSIKTIGGACNYYFMEKYCEDTKIIFSYTILFAVWIKTAFAGLVIYWFGDVISLLNKLNEKLNKKTS